MAVSSKNAFGADRRPLTDRRSAPPWRSLWVCCLLVGVVPTASLIVPAVSHLCDPLQKSRASCNGRGVRRMRGRAWCPQTLLQRVGASHRWRSPPASVNTFFLRNVERFDSQTAGRDLMPKMRPAPMAIIQAMAPLSVARDAAPQRGQCLPYSMRT